MIHAKITCECGASIEMKENKKQGRNKEKCDECLREARNAGQRRRYQERDHRSNKKAPGHF